MLSAKHTALLATIKAIAIRHVESQLWLFYCLAIVRVALAKIGFFVQTTFGGLYSNREVLCDFIISMGIFQCLN